MVIARQESRGGISGERKEEEKEPRCAGDAREILRRLDIWYRAEAAEPHGRM